MRKTIRRFALASMTTGMAAAGLLLGAVTPAQSATAHDSVPAAPIAPRSGQAPGVAAPAVGTEPGGVYKSGGYCHFGNWGGSFFCQGSGLHFVAWKKPDGYIQVFVIGTNRHVFTRWASASGTSGWLDMGGVCNPDYGMDAASSGWSISVACVGTDGNWWHNTRATSGSWSGWKKGGV
ncbi:hypothetical protein [Streptomyces sp. NPDC002553]|uniref:hypothetical protein n=1 Tax=Streptomyces sp. NPDC002553 TaxID=3154417 RepID=UPI0033340653